MGALLHLKLSNNRLTRLPGSIGHLASLRLAVLPTLLVVLKSVMLPILALYYVQQTVLGPLGLIEGARGY